MKLHPIVCSDSVETAFQEMKDQEPHRLTYVNAGSEEYATVVEPLAPQGFALFRKGSVKCSSLGL